MIPVMFEYYKPTTLLEVKEIYNNLKEENKNTYYYSGGSEIVSMARANSITPDSVIDLKDIQEMQKLEIENDNLIIGACVTLTRLYESKLFKLLETTVSRIADHTNQNRITIGGNVCSTIIYREAVLPLLLSDAFVTIFTNGEQKDININNIFHKRINLQKGEFIVGFKIRTEFLNLPYWHIKKTKSTKIDYPLLTICALKYNNKLRVGFSGICEYPFRSIEIENALNENSLQTDEKVNKAIEQLPEDAVNSIEGSSSYKKFVLKNTLKDILKEM